MKKNKTIVLISLFVLVLAVMAASVYLSVVLRLDEASVAYASMAIIFVVSVFSLLISGSLFREKKNRTINKKRIVKILSFLILLFTLIALLVLYIFKLDIMLTIAVAGPLVGFLLGAMLIIIGSGLSKP